jgi:hypothetical protein
MHFERSVGCPWVLLELFKATLIFESLPSQIGNTTYAKRKRDVKFEIGILTMSMVFFFYKDKSVNTCKSSDDCHYIEQVLSRQYNSEVADLLGDDFVFERVQTKHATLFHVVQALSTLMHCLLRKTYQEWHHQETQ